LTNRIIKYNQSYFITGPGGSGKATLLKQLQEELSKKDKTSVNLSVGMCGYVKK